jgi:hypothetical protein
MRRKGDLLALDLWPFFSLIIFETAWVVTFRFGSPLIDWLMACGRLEEKSDKVQISDSKESISIKRTILLFLTFEADFGKYFRDNLNLEAILAILCKSRLFT